MLRGRADSGDEVNPPLHNDEPLPPVPHDDDHSEHSILQSAQTTLQRLMAVDLNPCEKYIKYIVMGFNALVLLFAFVLIGVGSAALNGDYESLTSTQISSGIIVLGVFFMLLGLLGLLAAWKEHRPTLGVYFFFLLILCFITLIVGIVVYVKKDNANYYITTAWQNIWKDDPVSGVLVDLQNIYNCCGLTNPKDDYTPFVKLFTNSTDSKMSCQPLQSPPITAGCVKHCPTSGILRACEPLIEQSFYDNFYTAGACGIAFAVLMAVMAVFIVLLFRGIGSKRHAESTIKAVSAEPNLNDEEEHGPQETHTV